MLSSAILQALGHQRGSAISMQNELFTGLLDVHFLYQSHSQDQYDP